ncbi:ATP-binding protein [Caldanaerobacter subterraneus]|uniref:Rad50/SbcC-type AAA domain-containing protein n=1 Tax=Caldanaerobacter subterraneus subsp. pacificus DSM 12653 TaxID=391606 RepID=B7R7A2_9THEO|nr:hypothetical protein [Caldanaerobacter subterraneus]KKC30230.1 hypothetical protein CDSM653_00708 [Caldanaerobacter subterraneus subsp. pacificus DSM 12653]
MRIKEFLITRYGPLGYKTKFVLGNFTLFVGKNESGKTLTIEALIKLLLGKNVKDFENIDRVEENPEGYVVLETEQGMEVKLPDKGTLIQVTGLSPTDCRNIFIIRNSDLSLDKEGAFYTEVTDKLMGLRSEEINKIKEKLREIGRITPTGIFRNVGEEKLKERIEKGQRLIEDIDKLHKKIKEEGLEDSELEYVKIAEEIEKLKSELEELEEARKREIYEKAENALKEINEYSKRLKVLERFNEAEWQKWRDHERDIEQYHREKEGALEELQKTEEELQKHENRYAVLKEEFEILEGRKKKLEENIKPELINYEKQKTEFRAWETKNSFWQPLAYASSILLAFSLLGLFFKYSSWMIFLTLVFLLSAVVSWAYSFQFWRKKGHLESLFEKIRLALAELELEGETLEKALAHIQRFEETYLQKNKDKEDMERQKERLENKIEQLRGRIENLEEKIRSVQNVIARIKENSGEETLEGYKKKIEEKKDLETKIKGAERELRSLLGGEAISYWEQAIEELSSYKDKALGRKYDEKEVDHLRRKRQQLEEKLETLEKQREDIKRVMTEIEKRAGEILRSEKYLYCHTLADLEKIKEELQKFIQENETRKNRVLTAIKIWEKIDREEKGKVATLFGEDSLVSKYFAVATEHRYRGVVYHQERGTVEVVREDGARLSPEKLSGGAYDQLYFAIRLALGKKLLASSGGFFILDDPFIKADPYRLKKQLQMVKEMAYKEGWQIIYFTAKGEVEEALREEKEKGEITYFKIEDFSHEEE